MITLFRNKATWLDNASHVASFNQSECIFSEYSSYASLKFVNDISPGLRKHPLMEVSTKKGCYYGESVITKILKNDLSPMTSSKQKFIYDKYLLSFAGDRMGLAMGLFSRKSWSLYISPSRKLLCLWPAPLIYLAHVFQTCLTVRSIRLCTNTSPPSWPEQQVFLNGPSPASFCLFFRSFHITTQMTSIDSTWTI